VNPWKESLGCEVNVCSAKDCDPERMKICALRKTYQERVAWLKLKRQLCRSKSLADKINKLLRGMNAE
jgi:hypothetical protein